MGQFEIPGFEMLEKLGEGGMATVWKARQISLDRTVAIKILSSNLTSGSSDVEMFQSEAQSTAKLKHPGIVQVYDASAQGGIYYFVMEYIAGYTVGDWARRKGTLSEKDALLVAECVSEALEYAWNTAGIVHCDIKPDNVMVDADGTVKVADLGLARSISAVQPGEMSDEIMGTPAFMSPEQSSGKADLDCRSDMYSLGAMLYHLLTGNLLFEGEKEDRVIELQESGKVPDIIELNSDVSHSMCWFVEKLLCKDKADRPLNWSSVKKDIARVKRGHMPVAPLPQVGRSTLQRSPLRNKMKSINSRRIAPAVSNSSNVPKIVIGIGLAAIVVVGAVLIYLQSQIPVRRGPLPSTSRVFTPSTIPPEVHDDRDAPAKAMFEFAEKWFNTHPDHYEEAIENFRKVVSQTRGTKYALMAEDRIRKITRDRNRGKTKVLVELKSGAESLIANQKYNEAAELYANYNGPFADETYEKRAATASALRDKVGEIEKKRKAMAEARAEKFENFLNELSLLLLSEGDEAATEAVCDAIEDEDFKRYSGPLNEIREIFEKVSTIDEKILDTFRRQKGERISVLLNSGRINMVLLNISDGKVYGQQELEEGVRAPVYFSIGDLSLKERVVRMGNSDEPENCLIKGLMALNAESFKHARSFFDKVHPFLSDRLVKQVDIAEMIKREKEAEDALKTITRYLGLSFDEYIEENWILNITSVEATSREIETVRSMVKVYKERFGDTEFAQKAEPVLSALMIINAKDKSWLSGGSDASLSRSLPSELESIRNDQKAIIKMMLELNPGLTEEQINLNTQGTISYVQIRSDDLENIGPLAAFTNLERLFLQFPRKNIKLKDIGPVANMITLRELVIENSSVSDLSPLANLPIQKLSLSHTAVKDISPLNTLQLSSLDLSGTKVFIFDPIANQPIRELRMNDTQVRKIDFVKDMPLSHLELSGTRVYDFEVLRGESLRHLDLSRTQVRDIEPLRNMPLTYLNLSKTSVKDMNHLRGSRIRRLDISETLVKDFSFLSGMPLENLNLADGRIRDISPLKGLPLTRLNLRNTSINDLSPLQGIKLVSLDIGGTDVSDLSPLEGMPLKRFYCKGIKTRDFDPLRGAPINVISVDKPRRLTGFLGTLPKLRRVNHYNIVSGMPVAPQLVDRP